MTDREIDLEEGRAKERAEIVALLMRETKAEGIDGPTRTTIVRLASQILHGAHRTAEKR
jgi:hypothetical protein